MPEHPRPYDPHTDTDLPSDIEIVEDWHAMQLRELDEVWPECTDDTGVND